MKKFLTIVFLSIFSIAVFGQEAKPIVKKKQTPAKGAVSKQPKTPATGKQTAAKTTNKPEVSTAQTASSSKKQTAKKSGVTSKTKSASPKPVDAEAEKAKLDAALALTSAEEKEAALKKFIHDFPNSEFRERASESLVTARAILADEKLQAGDNDGGIALFKIAVSEAPTPIPERLFDEIISKFPPNLFYRGQRAAAFELAATIEGKAAADPKQLLNLAAFYIGVEGGADAERLAEAAIALDPASITAYQTLGLAKRLDFDLEGSAKAYAKALELDPASVAAKRSLAEMKRALGLPEEAADLYSQIVAADPNDAAANTGLILSLFGAGKKADAEGEMAKALEQNPRNLNLLAGAAYWYAANDSADKAVELARQAIDLEPRFIWGHIALARALMSQKKPVEAERVLVMARQYGNFPTLEYEIASARLKAGFYREAAEELRKSFSIKGNLVSTRLGRRISREEASFADLVGYERKASIFEASSADDAETAAKLKLLFEMDQKLSTPSPDEAEISALSDEFVKGDDKMKLHREIYAATVLLQKNVALPKVMEFVKAAVGNADSGLDVATPAAAVMASELYESRTVAFARNEILVVPDVPRQTLSAILRGRIEELSGWALYQEKSYPEAVIRLRRAISVLPDKSAWWRSSMWRLGAALEADGREKEALDSYVRSYVTDKPSPLRYAVVEAIYKKVYGDTKGLESKIGPNPLLPVAAVETKDKLPAIPKSLVADSPKSKPPPSIVSKPSAEPSPTVAETAANAETPLKTVASDAGQEQPKQTPTELAGDAAKVADRSSESIPKPVETPGTTTAVPIVSSDPEHSQDRPAPSKEIVTAEEAVVSKTETPADVHSDPKSPASEHVKNPDRAQPESDPASAQKAATDDASVAAENTPKQESVNVAVPEKPDGARSQPADISKPVGDSADANAEPKPSVDKSSDTKALNNEVTAAQPEPTPAAPEVISKAETPLADEGVKRSPVQDATKLENPAAAAGKTAAKTEVPPEIQKSEIPVSSVTDAPANIDVPSSDAQTEKNASVIEKTEPEAPETKPNVETPGASSPKDEPKNLLRDPFSDDPEAGKDKLLVPEKQIDSTKTPDLEKPSPQKHSVNVTDPVGNGKPGITVKDLFDPIIINVPNSGQTKAVKKAADPTGESLTGGASRVRVVDGKEIKAESECSMQVSQEKVSLTNNGGTVGVLVSFADAKFQDVAALSSDPKDLEVLAEPEIAGLPGQRFYVLRSVSTATGIYRVSFESTCGKREITVTVR